jgi:hypothetical protein
MAEHKSSHFFLGFIVGVLVVVAGAGIAAYIVYNNYKDEVAQKEEKLLEDYSSQSVSNKVKVADVKLDYKYITYEVKDSTNYVYLHGKCDVAPISGIALNPAPTIAQGDFTLTATVSADSYTTIQNNLQGSPDATKDLWQNYDPVKIYYLADALSANSTKYTKFVSGSYAPDISGN